MNVHRVEAVRRKLQASKLDALLITFLPHIRYLTGFTGSNGLCVVAPDHQFFLTDGRYREQVRREIRGWKIGVTNNSLLSTLSKMRALENLRKVGIESDYLTVAGLESLRKSFPENRFIPTSSPVDELARTKEEEEIKNIRNAVEISDRVFREILGIIRVGIREREIAAHISYLHRKFGAETDAFEPIVASGERGCFPHAAATDKKIQNCELVVLDFGCRFNGYHSDLTRTVSVGKPGSEAKKVYQTVLDAQRKAIDAAVSGMEARKLDAVARNLIRRRGFGRFFVHSLGHGLGMQVHEFPRVSPRSKERLESGNVITIEPGIYKRGVGGVRIEDDVVIGDGHCEVLTKSPKELIIL